MKSDELLNRLTSSRGSQAGLIHYLDSQDSVLSRKLAWCGTWLHFREYLNTGDSRLINANFCKRFTLCRTCAVRRAGKMVEGYLPKVEAIMAENTHLVPAMLTLTVKNGHDLKERMDHICDARTKLLTQCRKARSSSGRHKENEANKIAGGVWSLEITKSKNGSGWHPHIHMFVLLDSFIDHSKLVEEWIKITGDSRNVDVRKCKGGVKAGLIEVLKYALKFSSLSDEDTWTVHDTLASRHTVSPFGNMRGAKAGDVDNDSIEDCEGPFWEWLAIWDHQKKGYRTKSLADPLQVERPDELPSAYNASKPAPKSSPCRGESGPQADNCPS